MNEREMRFFEVRFYYTLQKIYENSGSLTDVMSLIESLHMFSPFNTILVKQAAYRVFDDYAFRPQPFESVVLLYEHFYSVRDITKILGINNSKYYRICDFYKENPYPITNKFPKNTVIEIRKFLNAIKILNESEV